MYSFPESIDKILSQIAIEYRLKIVKETHYDAVNRELIWFEGNIQKRIDLTLMGDFIDVVYYKTHFKCCPKICLWLHNSIPMFPLFGKIYFLELDKIKLKEDQVDYSNKIKSYVEYAINN